MMLLLCPGYTAFAQNNGQDFDPKEKAELRALGSMFKVVRLQYQGKFNEVIPILTKRVDSLKAISDRDSTKKVNYLHELGNLAVTYELVGNFSKSELLLKRALAGDRGLENIHMHLTFLFQLAKLYEKMGNDEGAEKLLEELVFSEYGTAKHYSKKEQYKTYMRNMYKMSASYYREDLKKSLTANSKAKKKGEKAAPGSNVLIENLLKEMAETKPDNAEQERQLEEQWEEFSKQKAGADSNAMGVNMLNAMIKTYIRSMDNPPSNTPPAAADLDLLRQGLVTFDGYRNGIDLSASWDEVQRLFSIYKKKKNYAGAEALMVQAIAVDDREPNAVDPNVDIIKSIMTPQLSQALDKMGQPKLLSENMKQLVNVNERQGGVDIFYIQNKVLLAQLYKETNRTADYDTLVDDITEACKKFAGSTNPLLINCLAEAYIAMGKPTQAEAQYQKIIKYAKQPPYDKMIRSQHYLGALQKLGQLYRLRGNYTGAEDVLKQALAYDKKTLAEKYPEHMGRVIELAQLYESTNRFHLAEQYFTEIMAPVMNSITDNFGFLSEQEKMALLNNQISAFDLSASLLLTDRDPSAEFVRQTYNQQLQLKGLVLNDEQKLFESIRKNGNPQLQRLLRDWRSNRSAIAWQYSRPASARVSHIIDSLGSIANEQEKQINQLSGSFASYRQNNRIDFKQIQNKLTTDEVAIEFVRFKYYRKRWTDSTWYGAFVIAPGAATPRFVPLCEERKLTVLLSAAKTSSKQFITSFYGDGLTPGSNKITGRKSDELYKLVWGPIRPFLNGSNKIVIAPTGLLCRINFNALPADKDNYFIDKYEIRQFNSIRQLAEQKKSTSTYNKPTAVLYAAINYGVKEGSGSFWPALPGTLDEVNSLNDLYKSEKESTRLITGLNATEESLKQLSGKSPRLLYIATHGFAKSADNTIQDSAETQSTVADNPMFRSGIIMANANRVWSGSAPIEGKEDGIVTAYEIAGLDLSNTELVVLAACETALGDIKGAEGVFGLQRGFKLAGVQNMLLSLWSLPLPETIQLTKSFYPQKLSNGTSIYQAFKSAQLGIRKNNPPYNWAGMVLIE